MALTRHMINALIIQKNWQPYIKSHWIDFGRKRGGAVITFKEHEQFEYKCSNQTASEILGFASTKEVER